MKESIRYYVNFMDGREEGIAFFDRYSEALDYWKARFDEGCYASIWEEITTVTAKLIKN